MGDQKAMQMPEPDVTPSLTQVAKPISTPDIADRTEGSLFGVRLGDTLASGETPPDPGGLNGSGLSHPTGVGHRAALTRSLQRRRGNTFVQRAVLQRKASQTTAPATGLDIRQRLAAPRVQAKLTINPPGDVFEQEADRVANRVMRMPEPRVARREATARASDSPVQGLCPECEKKLRRQREKEESNPLEANGLQRVGTKVQLCSACAGTLQRQLEEDKNGSTPSNLTADQRSPTVPNKTIQRQPAEEKPETRAATDDTEIMECVADNSVYRQTTNGTSIPEVSSDTESYLKSSSGDGQPLSVSIRAFMEPRFGADFSSVRVHTSTAAHKASDDLDARAFTHTSDVYLARGESPSDHRLMAHELTHVAQQGYAPQPHKPNLNESEHNSTERAYRAPHSRTLTQIQRIPLGMPYVPWNAEWREKEYERYRQARERHKKWTLSHRERHQTNLAKQGRSLKNEIDQQGLLLLQLRTAMLKEAEKAQRSPKELKNKWAAAQLAVDTLESVLKAEQWQPKSLDIPRRQINVFYWELLQLVREDDRQAQELHEMINSVRTTPAPQPVCPNCHTPNQPESSPRSRTPALPPPRQYAPTIRKLMVNVERAKSKEQWNAVHKGFNTATAEMDRLLLSWLPQKSETLQSYQYTKGLQERQSGLLEKHPDAVRIPAVYYPKDEFVTENKKEGSSREVAKGIPWQFYLVRTPNPNPERWPVGFKWTLYDITARGAPKIDFFEPSNILKIVSTPKDFVNPPDKLFHKLNRKERFPEGMLYVSLPSGKILPVRMTQPWNVTDWLTALGITAAALGLILATAGAGTPAVAAFGASIGLSISATVADIYEKSQAGTLTERDVNRAVLSMVLDLASALTLGLGRVVRVAGQAGRLGRLGTAAGRYWFAAKRVSVGLQVIQLGVATHDFIQQYMIIQRSQLSKEEKIKSLRKLFLHGLITGGLMMISVKGDLKELKNGIALHIKIPDEGLPKIRLGSAEGPELSITNEGLVPPKKKGSLKSTTAQEDELIAEKYSGLTIKELRKKLAKDPDASVALWHRYSQMPDTELLRFRDDIAAAVMASRKKFDLARQMQGQGSFSKPEAFEPLLEAIDEARKGISARRRWRWSWLEPDLKSGESVGGTVGTAKIDTHGLEEIKGLDVTTLQDIQKQLVGRSPEAGGIRNPQSPFFPESSKGNQIPAKAVDHAEQDLADRLDTMLSQIPKQHRKGRRVFLLIEREVCTTCAAGLSNPASKARGPVRKLSEKYPEMIFEVKNLESSRKMVIRAGQDTNPAD